MGLFSRVSCRRKNPESKEWKEHDIPHILWAGRFLKLKHAMDALEALRVLKDEGLKFEMTLIGGGECEEELKDFVLRERVEETVTFYRCPYSGRSTGVYGNARTYICLQANIEEGWGAVANEAMNSGCAHSIPCGRCSSVS